MFESHFCAVCQGDGETACDIREWEHAAILLIEAQAAGIERERLRQQISKWNTPRRGLYAQGYLTLKEDLLSLLSEFGTSDGAPLCSVCGKESWAACHLDPANVENGHGYRAPEGPSDD
jgi:hypothetical protein